MGAQNAEINALDILRRGFLYMLIAYVVITIGNVTGLMVLPDLMSLMSLALSPSPAILRSPGLLPSLPSLEAFIGTLIVFLVVILLATGISLYTILRKIRDGMRLMTQVYEDFGICYKGTTLMLGGPIIMALGLIVAVTSVAIALTNIVNSPSITSWHGAFSAMAGAITGGNILSIIGFIIIMIGQILVFGIGGLRLRDKYDNILYLVAGILFIIGVVGPLSLVGCILMYIALGDTIKKLTQMKP